MQTYFAERINMEHNYSMIELHRARWRLAVVWFPAGALLMIVLVVQSLSGAFGGDLQRVWGWALPNFLPTIALMLSVFAAEALKPLGDSRVFVRRNFCFLSVGLSVFYVALLFVSILSPPLIGYFAADGVSVNKIKILEDSNLWLGPMQGLVVVAVGVLFFLKEEEGPKSGGTPERLSG